MAFYRIDSDRYANIGNFIIQRIWFFLHASVRYFRREEKCKACCSGQQISDTPLGCLAAISCS
jgi:hypothetical protein